MQINPAIQGRLSVVAHGRVGSPDLSADGTTVVYNEFNGETTFVSRHRDGDSVKLTNDGYPSMHPSVSADGSTVVYTRYDDPLPTNPGSWDIYRWREGEGNDAISEEVGNEMSPQVSHDGNVIVWDDDVDGVFGRNDIKKWIDGEMVPVTESPRLDLFPELSGDGSRLIWRRYAEGKSSVWMQDQNGVVKPFIEKDGDIIRPSLSTDGVEMIFADKSEGDADLVYHNESNRQERLVSGERQVEETWGKISGDGSTIAWTGLDFRQGAPADTQIYIEKEGQILQLTSGDDGMNHDPVLSEDGNTIIWTWMSDQDINDRKIYKFEIDSIDGPAS